MPPLTLPNLTFPRSVHNRPALDRVAYRIGAYPEFRAALFRAIDEAPPLAAWTHRAADDPGIALLEGAAIVGDILTFYQELYANEAWLRTARWPESITDLVRLLGYRLSPGLAGSGVFAFAVKPGEPVVLPAGLPIKAGLADVEGPADFETANELVAHPTLSKFHLYRTRNYKLDRLTVNATRFEIEAVGGASHAHVLAGLDLPAGTRLAILPPEPMWSVNNTAFTIQPRPEFVTVKSATFALGRLVVEIEGRLSRTWPGPVRARVVGRTFRHFGHNAPVHFTETTSSGGKIDGARQSNTWFARYLESNDEPYVTNVSPALGRALVPLDVEVQDLKLGTDFLISGRARIIEGNLLRNFTVVRRLSGLREDAARVGNLSGPSTLLTFSQDLLRNVALGQVRLDIRSTRIHELTSPVLTLRRVATHPTGGLPPASGGALQAYASRDEVRLLCGRRLYFVARDGRTAETICVNSPADFSSPISQRTWPRLWPVQLAPVPPGFTLQDFSETDPAVEVFGNIVDAHQGASHRLVVLGNGDARATFQTFQLPRAPLTRRLNAAATPPEQPELNVYVGGRAWTRVDSFFDRGPDDQVYLVRQDAEGQSHIQFGDGLTGARLPSGLKNITASFKTGQAARGPAKPGEDPTTPAKPRGLDAIHLLGVVAGGADPEDPEKARLAAPGKVQGLGRLVSPRDYETEVLALAGVVTATASWDLVDNSTALVLRVLLESGREGEFGSAGLTGTVADTIARLQRERGADRYPVLVHQAWLRHVWVRLTFSPDPALIPDDVAAAIRTALGLAGDDAAAREGLFGLRARRLGEAEYATRIEARVQQVPGVRWCRVTACGRFAPRLANPAAQAMPPAAAPHHPLLACPPDELLQLHPLHLQLIPA